MDAFVSLWSADLLALGAAMDRVEEVVDGFHLDVFDGHEVPELLFGPDLVAAVRARTDHVVDVHLTVADGEPWARRVIDAGADLVTVHRRACRDVAATVGAIRAAGASPSLGVEIDEPVGRVLDHLPDVERILVMATPVGVRGRAMDPRVPGRVRELVAARDRDPERRARRRPRIVVDGGIREHTVGQLAEAGADGVVPGSLVFGDVDPVEAVRRLHRLPGPTR